MLTDPFELERYRSHLAKNHLLTKLKNMYKTEYPEIKNKNTGVFWDVKNKFHYTNKNNPMAIDRINTSVKWIRKLKVKDLLDIGFGPANIENQLYLTNNKVNVTGIDISKESVTKAKRLYPKFKFFLGDLHSCFNKLNNNNYDCILAFEVLEHISPNSIFKLYKLIFQLLTNKGYLLVSVPLNEGLESLIKNENSNPNAHVRIYSPELIASELKLSGFKIIKAQTFYAFNTLYTLKKHITNIYTFGKKPNNILILAQKT